MTPTTLDLTVEQESEGGKEPRLQAKFAIETYVLPSQAPAEVTTNEE